MREPSAPGDSRMFRVASDALTKGPRRRQASAPNHLVRGVPWNEPYGTASHQLLRFEHDSIQQSTITPARVVGLWASMVFLSVDRKRSLRCSRCDTILRDPKLLGLSNLRELARVPQFKQGHLLSDQRSGASLHVLPLERAQLLNFVVDIRSHGYPFPSSVARDARQNGHRPCGSVGDRTAFR